MMSYNYVRLAHGVLPSNEPRRMCRLMDSHFDEGVDNSSGEYKQFIFCLLLKRFTKQTNKHKVAIKKTT